jgi:Ca-activated chloride channel homolog
MSIDANDPRLTAYALGEISDPNEIAEIESALENSEEMRRLVDEIRGTADLLAMELRTEPAVGLTPDQRNRIEKKANSYKSWFGFKPAWALTCAAAAVLLISILVIKQLNQTQPAPQPVQVAKNTSIPKEPAPAAVNEIEKPAAQKVQPPAISAAKIVKENPAKEKPGSNSAPMPPEEQAAPAAIAKSVVPVEPAKPVESAASIAPAVPVPLPQNGNASITGVVTDQSGGVLQGAKVTVTNTTTNVTQELATNNAGQYSIPALAVGNYSVTTEKPGFAKSTKSDIRLGAMAQLRMDFKLPVASTAASIEVAAQTENLILESGSSIGTVLSEDKINQLPLVNSNVLDLVKTMGGAVMTESPIFGADQTTLAGLSAANVNVQRDGVSANDVRWATGMNTPVNLNPESIGEFKVILAPVDAEKARGRGETVVKGRDGRLYAIKRQPGRFNTESYDRILDNPFLDALQNPLSTFSIDVDTASYSNMRRYLDRGSLPPKDSVRIEELVNYFDYDYKGPKDNKPFAANFELTEAPWNKDRLLLRIGLKGREIDRRERPSSNLVFLLDISGSMGEPNKLPLVKQAMHMLLNQLTESDKVSIVVYATESSVWLPPTSGDQKMKIGTAIERLFASGSTNGASGIQLAYQMAKDGFIKGGVNRVILATDGDFNVGITNKSDLANLIEEKAKSGIFLSALGFGMGNLKDATLEMLANKGRGNYAYIDTWSEAQKALVEQMNSTLIAIAKDVKIQVEFNPKYVGSYRLIGYEDKIMAKEDFNNDEKMASTIGAGHRITALYEIVPPGNSPAAGVDPLKYQKQPQPSSNAGGDEMLTLKIRSKEPEGDKSVLSEYTVKNSSTKFSQASQDFKFAASVAAFGMLLRDSPYKGNASFDNVLEWAKEGKGVDKNGYREDFIRLVHRAIGIGF